MASTLRMGERTPSKNFPEIISISINVITTILGLFVSLYASAHQEPDWAIFFSLLTALSAVMLVRDGRTFWRRELYTPDKDACAHRDSKSASG